MTYEKAIEIIKTCMVLDDCFTTEAGEMAINALETQKEMKETMVELDITNAVEMLCNGELTPEQQKPLGIIIKAMLRRGMKGEELEE